MILDDVFLIVLRTGVVLGFALAAGLLARRAPALRLAIYRLGLAAALVVAAASPWLRESPRPLVPVRWSSLPTAVMTTLPAPTPTRFSVANDRQTPPRAPFDPFTLVAPLWVAGSGLLFLRLALGYAGLARIRRACQTVECPPAEEIAQALGIAAPTVVEGGAVGSPFVAGARRATVFLPQGWTPAPDVMRAVLRHELAHVANGDLRWNLFRRLAQIALWPQPLLWPFPRAMDAAGEEVCDVQALASGMPSVRYAECLLSLRARPTPPLGIGAVASRSSLSRRVEAILDARRSRTTRLSRPLSLALRVGALGLAAGAALVFARPALPAAATQDPTRNWIKRPYKERVRLLSALGKPIVGAQAWLVVTGDVSTHEAKALRIEGSEIVLDTSKFSDETTATLVVSAKGYGLGFANAWSAPTRLTALTMPESVALTGRIVLPNGKPGAGLRTRVTMLVRRSDAGTVFALLSAISNLDLGATTAADGTFRIDGLPPSVNVAYDVDDVRFAQPVYNDRPELGAGGTTRAKDLVLRPAARLTGRLTRGGKPVAGVKIAAQGNHEKGNYEGWGEATTDARGRYAIERLSAGPYNVAVDLQRMPGATAVAHEGVGAKAGETVSNLDFTLIPGVFVEGRVADGAGNPVRTELGVYGPAHPKSSAWVQTGKTGADGRYRLRVPPGEQYVYLYDSGYVAEAQTIRVASGTATLDFRVVPKKPESARTAPASETTSEEPQEDDKDPGPVPPVSSFGPGKPFYGPVRLKAGGTVRLAYIQDDERGSHTLWRPDGSAADRADVAASLNLKGFEAKTAPRRMFARIEAVGVRLDGFGCVVQVPHRSTWSVYQSYGDDANRTLDLATFQAPRALEVTDLRLGIASGPWTVVRSGKPGTFARLGPANGPVVVTVPMTPALERRNVAIKAYDRAGRALDLALETGTAKDRKTGLLSRSYHFAGDVADVVRIDLLARDYEWVTFKGIQLYPKPR